MNAELETFLAPFPPDVRALALRVRALILDVIPEAIEQFDPPARLIGYGVDRTYKGLICGITLHKAHVNLMFARGTELPDPDGLLAGSGKRARHVRIARLEDVAAPALRALLEAAVAAQRQ